MADFQDRQGDFGRRRVAVIAASVDPWGEAQKAQSEKKLFFSLAYGLEGRKVAALTGAFFDESKGYLQATGFILDPTGRVATAVYSTGPIGRLTAADCLAVIDFLSRPAA